MDLWLREFLIGENNELRSWHLLSYIFKLLFELSEKTFNLNLVSIFKINLNLVKSLTETFKNLNLVSFNLVLSEVKLKLIWI